MAYNLKHTGAEIDAQIDRVKDGSVVTDNTLSNIEPGKLPVSGDALVEEFLAVGNMIHSLRKEMYVKDNVFYATMFDEGDVALTDEDREKNYTAIYTLIQRYGSVDALPKDLIVYLVMKDDRSDDGFTKYQCDTIKSVGGKIVVSFVFPYCKTDDATGGINFTTVEIASPFDTKQLSVGEIEILTFIKGAVTNTIDPGNDENPVSGVAVADYVTSRDIVFKATKEPGFANVYLSDNDKSWAVTCIRKLIERDNSQQLNNEYIFIEVLDPNEQNTYYRAACSKHSTDHGVFRAAFTLHEEVDESSYEYYSLEIVAPSDNNVNASDIGFTCDHIHLTELMNGYYAKMLNRGYIFKGIYDENATIDEHERMVFYIAQGKGQTIINIQSLAGVKLEKGRMYAIKNISKTTDGYDDRWEYEVIAEGLVTEERLGEVLADYTSKAYIQTDVIPRIEGKATSEGYYPKMSVGFADNLVGRGEATPEEFNFRASAGHQSIEDDVARVKRIKGNSLVWNQSVAEPIKHASENIGQTSQGGVIYRARYSNVHTGAAHKCLLGINIDVPSDNVIKASGSRVFSFNRNTNNEVRNYFNGNTNPEMFTKGIHLVSLIETKQFTDIIFDFELPSDTTDYAKCELYVYDLTQMFGSGNEPTTFDEFYARIPSGVDIHAYNDGEIISCNTEAINTVGFNQWDEQWAIDGSRIYSKNLISVLPNTAYYVKGKFDNGIFWYDENKQNISTIYPTNAIVKSPATARYMRFYLGASYGTTYKNDICINLSHTGIKNGTYKPYTPFIREMSVIRRYFPNGMRSAGEAYDEISFDSSKQKWVAIQRIESVDLESANWQYTSVGSFLSINLFSKPIAPPKDWTMKSNILCVKYETESQDVVFNVTKDKTIASWAESVRIVDSAYTDVTSFRESLKGVMLYYELAEPIVTEIDEELNLDYYVEDFGTERAVSSVASTPFRADIVYTFNAVDSIRINRLRIEELSAKIEQLVASVSAMAASNEEVE